MKSHIFSLALVCSAPRTPAHRAVRQPTYIVLMLGLQALLWPSPVSACETLKASGPSSNCVVMPLHSRSGVWFELKTADKLRRASLVIPELQLQLKRYEEIETTRGIESKALRDAVELRRESSDMLKTILSQHVREARNAREDAAELRNEMGAWYRNVWLWSGVSAILGGSMVLWLTND